MPSRSFKDVCHILLIAEPDDTLTADNITRPYPGVFFKLSSIKRVAAVVHKRADTVLILIRAFMFMFVMMVVVMPVSVFSMLIMSVMTMFVMFVPVIVVIVFVMVAVFMLVMVVVIAVLMVMITLFIIIVIFFRTFFQFGDPARTFKDFFKVKPLCRKQILERHLTPRCLYHLNMGLELSNNRSHFFHLIFRYQIFFIDNERRTKLNLLDEERFDIFFSHILF